MSQAGDWEIKRRRVTLWGRVRLASGEPAACAIVSVSGGPKKLDATRRRGQGRSPIEQGVTRVRPNGLYFFLDLPAGEYAVTAKGRRAEERAAGHAKLARDKDGEIRAAVVDLTFPPG